MILNFLDLQSLLRLSSTSVRAHTTIDSLPAFQHLLSSTGHILPTLPHKRIITLHSLSTLHAALTSTLCISCGHYGAFLLLVTAQRCCSICLEKNASLWLLTTNEAHKIFALAPDDVKKLPAMQHVVPGHSFPEPYYLDTPKRYVLTSVRAAKELAIKVHGSEAGMETVKANIAWKQSTTTRTECRRDIYIYPPRGPVAAGPGRQFYGNRGRGGPLSWVGRCGVSVVGDA
ncbi:hypothetical protein BT63DRAFT_192783 [Microthyrium microscopicum]|uniref:F-box domain-containing protein n=1 Tax=Microthyrium microscopicum TaxID=703497 RepID=A0A6A6UKQ6_9PEZI|nr:hypothetical protein BT63DRAFT_192783 [Microthyrium microscopicum]